jgi:hypothetical protein
MKICMRLMIMVVLTGCFSGFSQNTENPSNTDSPAKITLPWQEFRELLHLDDRQIVIGMETFQKLLEQTGTRIKPVYTVKNGNVILSRQEFENLVNQMKPPQTADEAPPFEFLITKAVYSGRMEKESTFFKGIFQVQVLKQNGYVRIPVLPQNLALEEMRVNQKQALVVSENGYHTLLLKDPGQYQVEAAFSVQSSLEKGPHRIDMPIQNTPITLLELDIPMTRIDVEIPQAQQTRLQIANGRTKIYSILSSGYQVSIRWRRQLIAAEKVPPKLYAEIQHLISIEDDALKINSEILLNILHSEIEEIRIGMPQDLNVLSVSGEGVGEWQEETVRNERTLRIPFTYSKKGAMSIQVISEAPMTEGNRSIEFRGFELHDAVRETGYAGVELNTSAEVKVTEIISVDKIPIQKLPQQLYDRSKKPLILGFKYLKHPFNIVMSIEKHEKIAVPMATIESANAVTLFTEDGKIVHRLIFKVRNSAKQFLELRIPEDADVWGVFVDNEPVESSINTEGSLLIPLIRSRSVDNQLELFSVEVILCVVQNRFSLMHELTVNLPNTDLLTSQILWSVYLPNDYHYIHFRSTLEKEEILRGVKIFQAAKRNVNEDAKQRLSQKGELDVQQMPSEALNQVYQGKDYSSQFRNVPLDEAQMKSQVENELALSDRLQELSRQEVTVASSGSMATGVLPIQIKIPTSGQVYRFAKTIIKENDPLRVRVLYLRQWVSNAFRWFLLLLVIAGLYKLRKYIQKWFSWIGLGWKQLNKMVQKRKKTLQKIFQARMFPFALLGIAVLCLGVSKFLSVCILVLFFGVVLSRIFNYLDKRKQKKR